MRRLEVRYLLEDRREFEDLKKHLIKNNFSFGKELKRGVLIIDPSSDFWGRISFNPPSYQDAHLIVPSYSRLEGVVSKFYTIQKRRESQGLRLSNS